MIGVVSAAADTADQCAHPRPAVDAVDGAATLPRRLSRQYQVIEVEVVIGPVAEDPLRVWFDRHCSFCPLSLLSVDLRCVPVTRCAPPFPSILGSPGAHL